MISSIKESYEKEKEKEKEREKLKEVDTFSPYSKKFSYENYREREKEKENEIIRSCSVDKKILY